VANDVRRDLNAAIGAAFRGAEIPPVPTGPKARKELAYLADELNRQEAFGLLHACVTVALRMAEVSDGR
jgi:hypothetical protein